MRKALAIMWTVILVAIVQFVDIKPVMAVYLGEPPYVVSQPEGFGIYASSTGIIYEYLLPPGPNTGIWRNRLVSGGLQFASNDAHVPGAPVGSPVDLITDVHGGLFCASSDVNAWINEHTTLLTGNFDAGSSGTNLPYGGLIAIAPRGSDSHVISLTGFKDQNGLLSCRGNFSSADTNGVSAFRGVVILENNTARGWNMRAFVTGGDSGLYSDNYNGFSWQGWVGLGSLGGHTSVESVGATAWYNSDGSLLHENVFWRGNDNALWNMYSYDGINWSAPASLGGVIASGPGCGTPTSNTITCAALGQNGHVWMIQWINGWGQWQDLGTPY